MFVCERQVAPFITTVYFVIVYNGFYNHLKLFAEQRLERMRARLTAKTHEERDARLERLRAAQQERLTAETHEERDARLERMRAAQQERLWQLRLLKRGRPGSCMIELVTVSYGMHSQDCHCLNSTLFNQKS